MTRARNIAGFSTITTTPSPVHVGPIGVLTATRIDGEFNQVDLATRNITAAGIAATNLQVSGITTGLNVSGIITAQNGINFNGTSTGLNVSGVATFANNVTIGGVLTYEDVTRVDSVGVITAREQVHVGTGVSIASGGLNVTAGVSTFGGNIYISDRIYHSGDTNTQIRFPAVDTFTVETAGSERLRVSAAGVLGVRTTPEVWHTDRRAVQVGGACLSGQNPADGQELALTNNGYYDSSDDRWEFIANDDASGIFMSNGGISFKRSPSSGTADAALSWTESMFITDTGNLKIGGGAHSRKLAVHEATNAVILIEGASNGTSNLFFGDESDEDVGMFTYNHASNFLSCTVNTGEALRIDSAGALLVAHTSGRNNFNSASSTEHAPIIQLEGTNQRRAISVTSTNTSDGGILMLARQNGNPGTNTVVSSGDQIGRVDFQASGGTNMEVAAQITAEVDGSPGDNDMPGRILFKTTADGANSSTERVRIDSSGRMGINATPSDFNSSADDLVVRGDNINTGITIMTTNGGLNTSLVFADGTSGGADFQGAVQYLHNGDHMRFLVAQNERARLNGNGLCFNGDSAEANALDDYEEGVFTVTLANSLAVGTQTQLSYTKIGNKVHISGQIKVTTGGSDLTITNLPYTTVNTGGTDEKFSVGFIGTYYVTMPTDGSASGELYSKTQKNDNNMYVMYNRNGTDPNQHTATTNGYYTFNHWYTSIT